MKILLVGKNGQLGWELQRCLASLGEVLPLDYPEVDLIQPGAVASHIHSLRPQIVVNATAYTLVDKAETETRTAFAINGQAPGEMAEAAAKVGAALLHYSTDYVFDGAKGQPYVESDPTHPLSVYGESKLAGEQAIAQVGGAYLTFRTAWVYSLRRDNFVAKVLQWSRQQPVLKVVSDQISNPTWARSLAEVSAQVLAQSIASGDPQAWLSERRGLYHLAGDGYTSRMEWARRILALDPQPHEQATRELLPAQTNDFPTPATRPLFSALDCQRFTETFGLRLPNWEHALRLAMDV